MVIVDIGVGENPRGDINIDIVRTRFCNLIASAESLPIKNESENMIVCGEVLEHLATEINRILNQNAQAMIDFPKPFFINHAKFRLIQFPLVCILL